MVNSNQLIQSNKQTRSLTERFKNYWHIRLAKPGQLEREAWIDTEKAHRATITELNAANDHLQKTSFDLQLASHRYRQALTSFNNSHGVMSNHLGETISANCQIDQT